MYAEYNATNFPCIITLISYNIKRVYTNLNCSSTTLSTRSTAVLQYIYRSGAPLINYSKYPKLQFVFLAWNIGPILVLFNASWNSQFPSRNGQFWCSFSYPFFVNFIDLKNTNRQGKKLPPEIRCIQFFFKIILILIR